MVFQSLQANRYAPAFALPDKKKSDVTSIGIIGLGYVGLPLSILASTRGFRTVGFDIDDVKVAQLSRREASFLNDDESVAFKRAQSITVTSDERALDGLDAYVISVPTPVHEDRTPDLEPLQSACEIVGRHLHEGALVVVESTVSPGVCEDVALSILVDISNLSPDTFDFAHCPERVNPGDPRWNVRTIPRVLGATSRAGLDHAGALYESLLDAPIIRMGSIKEAEAVKMLENAFRDINIAFVNELAISFDRAGIDLVNVIAGASTKPFGYMPFYPGCGVGGHCIPVDPYYLIRYGRENGFEHKFLIAARRVNAKMPAYAVKVLERAMRRKGKSLMGARVALLGLTYKRGVPDTRESPALQIRELLIRRGAVVQAYDPLVAGDAPRVEDALSRAEAAIVATDHAEFRALTPEHFRAHGVTLVVDGRNCLEKSLFYGSGVKYRGIGRGT
ncbi:nucleotide sugar dehydrogenase [Candidatus Kaiserbacteria bacterium]|nr:nucleotide sugar dehydrogenase [Candidatus Kaiserbacteria bacterium]